MTAPSDSELLQLFRSGKKDYAFECIVKKYQKPLYKHIRHMVSDHDDTNDLLQNTFIKAWKALDNFREESQLYTWLYRIASNESLTFLKKLSRTRKVPVEEMGYALAADDDDTADTMAIQRKLLESIGDLPDKQRLVFNLKYFDEMKYEDMAKVLDTSVGALKASFHHAVKKIEESLKAFKP